MAVAQPAALAQTGPTGTPPAGFDPGRYGLLLDQVIARQRELGARYAAARGARARSAIRDEARRFVVETLVSQVFPAWMGMPSAGGPQATASLPHQPGMYISCSYFLTAALQNAGLVLARAARASRRRRRRGSSARCSRRAARSIATATFHPRIWNAGWSSLATGSTSSA